MGFDIGNIMGLAGDAVDLFATGGMDPSAWMDAVNEVGSMAGGGSSGGSSSGMESVLGSLEMSMLQSSTDA